MWIQRERDKDSALLLWLAAQGTAATHAIGEKEPTSAIWTKLGGEHVVIFAHGIILASLARTLEAETGEAGDGVKHTHTHTFHNTHAYP